MGRGQPRQRSEARRGGAGTRQSRLLSADGEVRAMAGTGTRTNGRGQDAGQVPRDETAGRDGSRVDGWMDGESERQIEGEQREGGEDAGELSERALGRSWGSGR